VISDDMIGTHRKLSADQIGSFTELSDGSRVLILRVHHNKASAVTLHLSGLRLPAGMRMFVYALSNGAAIDVAGPWEASGPSPDGSFWTPAVRGAEAVIELQTDGELPSDLPFDILEVASADGAQTEQPTSGGEVRTSIYRGVAITHQMADGIGIFEGDIILGSDADLQPPGDSKTRDRSAVAISNTWYRWPGGIVPYVIDPLIPSPSRVQSAVNHWNTKMQGIVQMIPRTTEVNFVRFTRASSSTQCASFVGMIRNQQPLYVGDSCSTGNVIHEIGHAFGLWHEQSREDRNTYVKINWANIRRGYEHNFNQNITDGDDINGYDYGSIMHYPANSFSVNGQPTIETIPAGIPIGQRSALSAGDIAAITRLYPPAPAPAMAQTIPVTVRTSPAGLQMRVDGALYTAATTFNWTAGSTHTIEGLDTTPAAGTLYKFTHWSDAGARSHTITATTTVTAYTATYSLNFVTQTSVAPSVSAGTAQVTNPLAGDYYPANSILGLSATAASGYCFTGWTELLQGTPAKTTLTVTKPYWIRANFGTGAISLSPAAASVTSAGGTMQLSVSATTGCLWEARTDVPWITFTAGRSGAGPLALAYTVASNTTSVARTGRITVEGKVHTITQAAAVVVPAVTRLVLINADTNLPIGDLTSGMTLNLTTSLARNFNVQAITGAGIVGSVQFRLNGSVFRTENSAPYAFAGDTNGDYWVWQPPVGTLTISAAAFSGASATGTAGAARSVIINVVR
jgi:hypothetical protein